MWSAAMMIRRREVVDRAVGQQPGRPLDEGEDLGRGGRQSVAGPPGHPDDAAHVWWDLPDPEHPFWTLRAQFRWCAPVGVLRPAGEGSPEIRSTAATSRSATADGLLGGGCLDHHPHEGLGAARAHEHPTLAGQLDLGHGDVLREALDDAGVLAGRPRTLRSTCGSRVITAARSASGRPVRAITSSSWMPVSTPSPVLARSEKITWPDCSPPSAKPPVGHRLEHRAVAHVGLDDLDAVRLPSRGGSRGSSSR